MLFPILAGELAHGLRLSSPAWLAIPSPPQLLGMASDMKPA